MSKCVSTFVTTSFLRLLFTSRSPSSNSFLIALSAIPIFVPPRGLCIDVTLSLIAFPVSSVDSFSFTVETASSPPKAITLTRVDGRLRGKTSTSSSPPSISSSKITLMNRLKASKRPSVTLVLPSRRKTTSRRGGGREEEECRGKGESSQWISRSRQENASPGERGDKES